MSEVKQRRKANLSTKPNEDEQKEQLGSESTASRKSFRMDPRTILSSLSLLACIGLTWFLFQQSAQLVAVEEKYHLLKHEAVKFQDIENKINLMSQKFESSSDILQEQEASTSVSMMPMFEKEVSSLRNIMHNIQNNEQTFSKKLLSINEKFQNVIDSWKRSQGQMDTNTSSLKTEAKLLHSKATSQINAADQKIKSLSERLKDLEDSTVRNVRTLKRQEEDELSKVEQQQQFVRETAGKLEEQQNSLLARNTDLNQKLTDYEPKVKECKTYLPAIESAIHSVVRVSSGLIGIEKKTEDMTITIFNVEDEIMKAVSTIMDIQKTLEDMQYENSILKLQNEVLVLKGRVQNFAESTTKEHNLENHLSVNNGE
ncbi:inhibitor of nuclear factor kappa-B kinase-interacting protein isoform X1 [Hemicordylus capensis]|uniref:inhibitor of nuclear factor kappa-B kinase-interacting protein isoform X1 n=1 Tax=Hemicordylus capensis TaxID=884348 RepID=UPI0023040521|nr:inhibitor of nuclear factor kappa-B kinase-interacting protein isoform X1 [Hemicordylus capensis]XP_053113831.1 inhibitor of nuclear factor kappa-B kinase-interacting protein isoform X1 [Hemicordylus capensis]XP_053113832.1 inhibitor of nuclear factor kappa-B kinase-interacting protein isoform X1 [Hemicordylus capensis]